MGCDSLEKEIIKLKTENTNNNLSYYNFTIIPPENKKEFKKNTNLIIIEMIWIILLLKKL